MRGKVIGCDQSTGMKDCELLFVIITSLNITINLCVCSTCTRTLNSLKCSQPRCSIRRPPTLSGTRGWPSVRTCWRSCRGSTTTFPLVSCILATPNKFIAHPAPVTMHIRHRLQCTSGTGYNAHPAPVTMHTRYQKNGIQPSKETQA